MIRLTKVLSTSMVDRSGNQRVDLWFESDLNEHGTLTVSDMKDRPLHTLPLAVHNGRYHTIVLLPEATEDREILWSYCTKGGETCSLSAPWKKPRHWTLYFMASSHTDIGLHNSQYIQRYNSERFLDKAMELCDQNPDYRYVMEGTWFWENYPRDRGEEAAGQVVEKYIKSGKIGLCTGVAGNHTQVFGLEEMCRAANERRRMREAWGIDCHTMTMIDNNGLSWGMVQPFAQAGYENIIFAPNQWNPLYSTVWHMNGCDTQATWNPNYGGGGAYIDARYDSTTPQVFWWQAANARDRMLVWLGGNYGSGASVFGLAFDADDSIQRLLCMEENTAMQLPAMEEKYPYDVWFCTCYMDDQEPDPGMSHAITRWNKKWAWPKMEMVGDPDKPFSELKARYADQIPVLTGEITGGWYQHPVSTAELLADKFEADRRLPVAEKLATLAGLTDPAYRYPQEAFTRAWNALLWNDEHSYGTSGYQGRRVYETWLQHRDWIGKARNTADTETEKALSVLAGAINAPEKSWMIFNPTGHDRIARLTLQDGRLLPLTKVPAFGYTLIPDRSAVSQDEMVSICTDSAPTVENKWYRLVFGKQGQILSIRDLLLNRELLDPDAPYAGNQLVYTRDNHKTFSLSGNATFTVTNAEDGIRVVSEADHADLGARVIQEVFLPADEKRVEITNRILHAGDLFNTNRYYRYAYYAFPFMMDQSKRLCHLNGCVAEYGKDLTGHGTDTYMAARDWACLERDGFGVGFAQLDSELLEFDHIHPDKTDCGDPGEGSHLYAYLCNDWLQMHCSGPSMLNFTFRYAITSYEGTWQTAGLEDMAEDFGTPLLIAPVEHGTGKLPAAETSFLKTEAGCRLIALKMAENGQGLILRLYRSVEGKGWKQLNMKGLTASRVTVDEYPMDSGDTWQGFASWRLTGQDLTPASPQSEKDPYRIGTIYTGLVDEPRGARGEYNGHLYLLWGAVMDKDLAGYEVYRGTEPEFPADQSHLAATVAPECYRVGRFSDTGLKDGTRYYYRVRAFDKNGRFGPFTDVFSALTKEV